MKFDNFHVICYSGIVKYKLGEKYEHKRMDYQKIRKRC